MTEAKNIIEYKPFRGHLEPVGEVRKAEIKLMHNHLELVYDYDFTDILGTEDVRTSALLVSRSNLSVGLATWHHEDDKDKVSFPRIELIVNGSYQEFIYIKTMDEAYRIYRKLKTWIINE